MKENKFYCRRGLFALIRFDRGPQISFAGTMENKQNRAKDKKKSNIFVPVRRSYFIP